MILRQPHPRPCLLRSAGAALIALAVVTAHAPAADEAGEPAPDQGQAASSASEAQSLQAIGERIGRLLDSIEQTKIPELRKDSRAIREMLEQAEAAEQRARSAERQSREAVRQTLESLSEAIERSQSEGEADGVAQVGQASGTAGADTGMDGAIGVPGTLRQAVWVIAAVAAGLVLLQAGLAFVATVRRHAGRNRQLEQQRRLYEARVRAAERQRAEETMRTLHWSGPRMFEVRAKRFEDEDQQICSFELVPHDGKAIPSFYPGQYLTFSLKIPGWAKHVIRCYSISDAPRDDHYRISVKRLPPPPDQPEAPAGVASNFLHDRVHENDTLEVRAPAGEFCLDPREDDKPVVLIAGGIGLTPLLSMVNTIAEAGGRRETWLFYGVRHGGERIMRSHLDALARDYPQIHVRTVYSDPRPEDRSAGDYDHEGRIGVDLLRSELPSNNYDFYLCGPPPMMDAVIGQLTEWGVPEEHIHTEKFGPASGKKKPPSISDDATGPEITFRRSGVTAKWDANIEDLWEFAKANKVHIDSGCLQGCCGTCETAILSGKVKYPNKPTCKPEEGSCLPCCAIPDGPVTLDA